MSEATERMEGLMAKKTAFKLKRKQLISQREIEDIEQDIFRGEEDDKYSAVLAGWLREDEQIKKKGYSRTTR